MGLGEKQIVGPHFSLGESLNIHCKPTAWNSLSAQNQRHPALGNTKPFTCITYFDFVDF